MEDDNYTKNILKCVTKFMHRRGRPMYLGEIAAHIDHDLGSTARFMQALAEEGRARSLTIEEKSCLKIDRRGDLWEVINRHADDETD